jgi:hypothetical protein
MMDIMAYATTGREFEVMGDLASIGVDYWHGKRIEFERRGKARIAEPFEYPALPNYIHITAPFHRVSDIMDIRHLSRTVKFMHDTDARGWHVFQRAADARYAEAKRIVMERDMLSLANASRQDMINLIAQYKAGDTLEISGGAFAGMLATFGRMVVKAGTAYPMVEARVNMFGGEVSAAVDPLDVRRAV